MRNVSKKKLAITIVLAIIVIIELLTLGISRAEKVKEISCNVIDNENKIVNYTFSIEAFDGGESGYYITLPDIVNSKKISKYIVEEKNIVTEEDTTSESNKIEKTPGERVFLTEEELASAQISIEATYDTKIVNDAKLYNQVIKKEVQEESSYITVQGYMPLEATLEIEQVTDDVIEKFKQEVPENYNLIHTYKVKVMSDGKEYEITESSIIVTVSNMNTTKEYKVLQCVEEVQENRKCNNTNNRRDTRCNFIRRCIKF